MLPDDRDWQIIECIACDDDEGLNEFDDKDVERVENVLKTSTEEELLQAVADGHISADEIEAVRKGEQDKLEAVLSTAREVTYQLSSSGKKRSARFDDESDLFNAFYPLVDFGEEIDQIIEEKMLMLEVEGRHRTIFLNRDDLDYVIIPTHQWNQGAIDFRDEGLTEDPEDDEEDSRVVPMRKRKKNRNGKGEVAL